MTNPLIECIPNFSEARRPEVVQKIIESIQGVAGIHLLDRHSDLDHNRTVITYVGNPAAVSEAAFASIKTAAELIDLNQHQGEHPRIGATDVVPFVPIRDTSIQDCVRLAENLAKRVADELNIPVFLYEEAARISEKQNLENIRKGQFEALKEEIGSSPVRTPDYGPSELGSAGATVIGVRQPLIAFNIYLTTDDVSIAQKIGRAVRHSSGGLRYVKGMGVLVEGKAQVSMNLTNFSKTPIARVVEFVRREAARYGVAIHHSELVGLIPQTALIDAAQWYLQLDGFETKQILEQRLFDERQENTENANKEESFLNQLASADPAPGGGSAAAYSAAMGAALTTMVSRLTLGRKKYADVHAQMQTLEEESIQLQTELTTAIQEDADAFIQVMEAFKKPKSTPEEIVQRNNAIQAATIQAAELPFRAAQKALQIMKNAFQAARIGNINTISDAASGVIFARAGLRSACINVRTNTLSIQDQNKVDQLLASVRQLEKEAAEIEEQLTLLLQERGGFPN
ncbi:MAG: glutamate formimidoyltransferase [Chloroflexi bacterium 44-23]|nr:MAG: glutamate formimidoyltransferase [Chloroflexi bacterium 44-23]